MQARPKWWLFIGSVLVLAVVLGVWLRQSHTAAPGYQGKHVRTWVMEAYAGTNVSAAFAAMGPSAVPVLVELLHQQELPWQRQLRLLAPNLPSRLRRALFGRAAIIPTAVKLRCGAARCLGLLGPQAATKALVQNYRALRLTAATFRKLAQSENAASRELALETLGILGADDDATPNILRASLKDPDPKVRLAAVKAPRLPSLESASRLASPHCLPQRPGSGRSGCRQGGSGPDAEGEPLANVLFHVANTVLVLSRIKHQASTF